MGQQLPSAYQRGSGLVDVLDRVLDKGLVVAGDIKVALAEVELLTIRIRLVVCSIDKAETIGLDWWKHDRYFGGGAGQVTDDDIRLELRSLHDQLARIEARSSLESAGARTRKKKVTSHADATKARTKKRGGIKGAR